MTKKLLVLILLSSMLLGCNVKSLVGVDALYKKDNSKKQTNAELTFDNSKGKNESKQINNAEQVNTTSTVNQGISTDGIVKIVGAIFAGLVSIVGVFAAGVKKQNKYGFKKGWFAPSFFYIQYK